LKATATVNVNFSNPFHCISLYLYLHDNHCSCNCAFQSLKYFHSTKQLMLIILTITQYKKLTIL